MAHPSDPANFPDLSGLSTSATDDQNPYNVLISACNNDPSKISDTYSTHRLARNTQQIPFLLSPTFTTFSTDPILSRLLARDSQNPDYTTYEDPRHCLVFWARPSQQVQQLITSIQSRLKPRFPATLWLMPPSNLHLTVLELAHSRTATEIDALLSTIQSSVSKIVDYTGELRDLPVLVKPMIGIDKAALALSFVPASSSAHGKNESVSGESGGSGEVYTYHHLRRDVFDLCRETGVQVGSRYVVPSAHLTIARWSEDLRKGSSGADGEGLQGEAGRTRETARELVKFVDELNEELRRLYWDEGSGEGKGGLRWVVGEEKGLVLRRGTVWYGGGESVAEGRGRVVESE